jgi:hypothetical protein
LSKTVFSAYARGDVDNGHGIGCERRPKKEFRGKHRIRRVHKHIKKAVFLHMK